MKFGLVRSIAVGKPSTTHVETCMRARDGQSDDTQKRKEGRLFHLAIHIHVLNDNVLGKRRKYIIVLIHLLSKSIPVLFGFFRFHLGLLLG